MSERKTVKGQIYLLAKKSHRYENELSFLISGCEMPDLGYTTVDTREVEMPIPNDVDKLAIIKKDLETEKKKIQEKAEVEIKEIDQRLDILNIGAEDNG